MKRHLQARSLSIPSGVLIAALSACGGGSSNGPIATQAEIDACHALCLRFGPEDCTRQCYALCDAKSGSCAQVVAGQTSMIEAMTCQGPTLNLHYRGGTLGCSAGPVAPSFSGTLPDGSWKSGKRMFVTSQRYRGGEIKQDGGMTTGLASADKLCANIAAAAGFSGTWKAWLSDSKTDAIGRIAEAGPWYNTSRSSILFRNKNDLSVGPRVWQPLDERGQVVQSSGSFSNPDVWTGTSSTGRYKAPALANKTNCSDWTANTYVEFGAAQPIYAYAGSLAMDSNWSEFSSTSECSALGHLYCFEQ